MAGFNRNQVADINRNARPNSSESADHIVPRNAGGGNDIMNLHSLY